MERIAQPKEAGAIFHRGHKYLFNSKTGVIFPWSKDFEEQLNMYEYIPKVYFEDEEKPAPKKEVEVVGKAMEQAEPSIEVAKPVEESEPVQVADTETATEEVPEEEEEIEQPKAIASRDDWAKYADSIGVSYPEGAKRDQIRELVKVFKRTHVVSRCS